MAAVPSTVVVLDILSATVAVVRLLAMLTLVDCSPGYTLLETYEGANTCSPGYNFLSRRGNTSAISFSLFVAPQATSESTTQSCCERCMALLVLFFVW